MSSCVINAQVVWTDDFSTPTNWTINNDGQVGSTFGWTIDNVSNGWWTPTGINSVSGGNFAELSNGDPTQSPGTQKENVTYTLTTTNAINIAGQGSNFKLSFLQYGARFNDLQEILISVDGINFISVGDNSTIPSYSTNGGAPYVNPSLKELNLNSSFIPLGSTSLYVRFKWTTLFPAVIDPMVWVTYGWYIDDVKLEVNASPNFGLGSINDYTAIANAQAMPLALAQNTTQFPFNMGLYVFNDGDQPQTNVHVNAAVTLNGSPVFSTTSNNFTIYSGDTLWVSFPTFTPTYAIGEYVTTYTIISSNTDNNPANNVVSSRFSITSDLYSLARVNSTPLPIADAHYRSGSPGLTHFETCTHLTHTGVNTQRAEGITFSAANGTDLTGKTVNLIVYDMAGNSNNMFPTSYIGSVIGTPTSYTFPSNLQATPIYVPLDNAVQLQSNTNYLFCVQNDNSFAIGFDTVINYSTNTNIYPHAQPTSPILTDNWYSGFTGKITTSIGVKVGECPTTVAVPTLPIHTVVCFGSTATISVTSEPGASVHWYDENTYNGVTNNQGDFNVVPPLHIGSTYNIPNVTTTKTFYAVQKVCNTYSLGVAVTVTVSQPTSTVFVTSCDASFAYHGSTYYSSGTYTGIVIPSSNGCDSTITLKLTLIAPIAVTNNQQICAGGSYTINGNTYTTAGTYTDVMPSVNGCDSTITTNLSIVSSFNVNNPQTICQGGSYSVGTSNYTTAGTYTNVLQSALGCDSTVTTILTVNPNYTINNPQTICQGGSYVIGANTYTTAGTYTNVFQTVAGCDSVIVTNLTVNPIYTINNPQSICQGDNYAIGTNTYTTAGTYTDVFQSAAGCDSTIVTVLTIISTQLNLNVTIVDSTLTAVQTNASYQWIDCLNGNVAIAGATSRNYTASLGGSFAVIVTKCGISDTSDCKYVSGLGVNEKSFNLEVSLYPNPATEVITISVNDAILEDLIITDLNGKQLFQQAAFGHTSEVQVESLSYGVYLMNIKTEKGTVVKRFIKE